MSRSGQDGERNAPRRPDTAPSLLAARAELRLGMRLVLRHRTVRLAGLLGAVLFALALIRHFHPSAPQPGIQTVLMIVGTVAAVAGGRVLAPGSPLAAARRAAAPSWLAPAGRCAGAVLVLTPFVWVVSLAVSIPLGVETALRTATVSTLYAAALVACVTGLAPWLGASGGVVVGLGMVWFGSLLPSTIAGLFHRWVLVERPAVLLWNLLPLGWRVERWVGHHGLEHLLLIGGWIGIGLALATWTSVAAYTDGRVGDVGG